MDGSFKRVFTDNVGTYYVVYVYPNGQEQVVDNNQDLYLEWIALGNVPVDVPYVEPTPEPPFVEELVSIKNRMIINIDTKTRGLIYQGFDFDSHHFSLSTDAQANWTRLLVMRGNGMLVLPQIVSTSSELSYTIQDDTAFLGFIAAFATVVKTRIESGITLRANVMNVYVSESMTEAEKRAWFAAFVDDRT
jgi:hypothetical protein